jgi:hypothetical protein
LSYHPAGAGVTVKTIGNRQQYLIRAQASGAALRAGALFNESIAQLARSTFIPKGVYRFKTHEAANQHQSDCLARGMALLAAKRSHDRTDQSSGNTR